MDAIIKTSTFFLILFPHTELAPAILLIVEIVLLDDGDAAFAQTALAPILLPPHHRRGALYALGIDYTATTDKKTIVNLTSHGFFSLSGIATPTATIDNLICQINADFYIPIDDTSVPYGCIAPVKNTAFDFTTPQEVGARIDADEEQIAHGAGYDHCFVLNKKEVGELSFAANCYPDALGHEA